MTAPRPVDLGEHGRLWPPTVVPSAAERVAAVVRESWALVEPYTNDLAKHFYARLFATVPEVRDLFPVNMQAQRSRLMRAVGTRCSSSTAPTSCTPSSGNSGATTASSAWSPRTTAHSARR